jgi:hypothetical protein
VRQLIKRILREEIEHEERLLGLIDQYVAMTYPNAIKVELSPPGGHIIMTSLINNAEGVENGTSDEDDVLIHKMDAYNMPHININKEFLMSVKSMFGGKKNIKNILEKWFDNKPVDMDLLGSSKQEQTEGLHDTSWENDEGDKITLIDLLNATEDIPVREISLNKIKSKLLTWDGNDEEIAKIEKADLQYPILIFVGDNNKFISIIDGHHRAHKALRKGLKKIKAKIIPINSLPKNIRKVFKGMGEQEEMKEGELTERCWKGYTQKGMKTMFGKRYPNCVKIKKKRVNESKMMDYLKQFLSGEVLDNYKKEKGRKEFQKMVDMVYKITAKDNRIEGMVGALVGNIDKNMWGRSFNDPNSVGARWDFTVILKPLFTNYNPNNESDYNERVLKFEQEFNQNAKGMGFELISPIQHEKVKNYRVKFEWASRLDVVEI